MRALKGRQGMHSERDRSHPLLRSSAMLAHPMVSWGCLMANGMGAHRMRDTTCLAQRSRYWPLFDDMSRGFRVSGNGVE
jgi:hypothetical protein